MDKSSQPGIIVGICSCSCRDHVSSILFITLSLLSLAAGKGHEVSPSPNTTQVRNCPCQCGPQGPPGLPGRDGRYGLPGASGASGRDGRDGAVGPPGRGGKDGLSGISGAPGSHGTPGLMEETVLWVHQAGMAGMGQAEEMEETVP